MTRRIATLLASALVCLTGCSLGGEPADTDLIAYFTDVGDLVPGATVQVSDVEIGSVRSIELVLDDGRMFAKVAMDVSQSHRVPAEDLSAVVRQTSLLGEQFVELVPSSDGAPFVGARRVTIPVERTERLVDVETFLTELTAFVGGGGLEDLNRFTHAQALILEGRGRRFGATLEELSDFTDVLAERRGDISSAIDHLAAAGTTLASNRQTLDRFLDSLENANALLADQGNRLGGLFRSMHRFGRVNARFLAKHEAAITRQFKALRPVLDGLADAQGSLRRDIDQLSTFFELFPKSLGGGPGGTGKGDYIQVDAVLCEVLAKCHTAGEKGDVPGEGS